MNRFRGKKKNRDESFGPRPSMESEPSGPFRMFGKKRLQEEEPKRELDLTAALPSTDDFRTSLLMTGLSARFSMLREQDDPNSILGKSSDDSVLFAKKHSRPTDFSPGASGLHDIAENESIKNPPLPHGDSLVWSDDAASTSGSVMNRARPVEGNVLFGGRQKIYKIPAGATSRSGGMGGRALYDDDVAQSAFQKWRQAERERRSTEEERPQEPVDNDAPTDRDARRDTGSTSSSSAPVTRESALTASTSSSSTRTGPIKDRQPSGSLASSVSQASLSDRSVFRTRRLYEQGLTQDLQDQQSSALSRMDTLSRQRNFGSRTPDLTPPVPSPTTTSFDDRITDRRPLIAKASAPNLRSKSPSVTGPTQLMSPPESGSKPSRSDPKTTFIGNPPLSPPISEAGDYPSLPIQPNDRGKATAMGVFQRPQQYDESKYAQRQRQLQQGRETPTGLAASEVNNNASDEIRLRASSLRTANADRTAPSITAPESSSSQKDSDPPPLSDDSDDASTDNRSSMPSITPQLTIERPDDQDHPAFRKSALPTPLSLCSSKMSDEFAAFAGKPGDLSPDPRLDPHDSPTLGPTPGLSGMVRQHLQHDSAASSISGTTDQEEGLRVSKSASSSGLGGATSTSARGSIPHDIGLPHSGSTKTGDQDDFARHLADGARRVRERLTSYVESDSDRSVAVPLPEPTREPSVLRPSGLGILRSKSSRGSLADREAQEPSRNKSFKAPFGTSAIAAPLASLSSGPNVSAEDATTTSRDGDDEQFSRRGSACSGRRGSTCSGRDENIQGGLKAFRQARREMQKIREQETRQRHQAAPKTATGELPKQSGSQEVGSSLPLLSRMPREDFRQSSHSSLASRATLEARDRSSSEASNGGVGQGGNSRRRNGSSAHEEHSSQHAQGSFGRRPSPKMGAAGRRPGTDTSQSPSRSATTVYSNMSPSQSTGNLDGTTGRRPTRGRDTVDPSGSPISYRQGPQYEAQPYGRSRNGSALAGAVSTPNLHAAAAAAAAGAAPPLPPINPRRKNGHGAFARRDVSRGATDDAYGSATTSDDDGLMSNHSQGPRSRVPSDTDGRGRRSPPRVALPGAFPQTSTSRAGLPGGMI